MRAALAHQNDFDVCWCKGSVSERLFLPLVALIPRQGGKIVGGQLVSGVSSDVHHSKSVYAGMKKLISSCPALGQRPEFRAIMDLKGLDVISTRLWLDQTIPTRFPANVLAGFEPGVGGTYFNLTELQV